MVSRRSDFSRYDSVSLKSVSSRTPLMPSSTRCNALNLHEIFKVDMRRRCKMHKTTQHSFDFSWRTCAVFFIWVRYNWNSAKPVYNLWATFVLVIFGKIITSPLGETYSWPMRVDGAGQDCGRKKVWGVQRASRHAYARQWKKPKTATTIARAESA